MSNEKKTHNINNLQSEININDNFNVTKICLPSIMTKYSNINSNQNDVEKIRNDNKQIYERFKDSNLYKDFPSPDRKEFIVKKAERLRKFAKSDRVDRNLLDFSKYNASKHKSIFCENYDINEGVMGKYKKTKDTFV